jgi:predicted flap endonuclease-1-like 5' DNA nuclease
MPTPQLQPQPTTIPGTGATAATAQAPAASKLPLTSIPGIGEARAYQLEAAGVDSLEKLAAATPEDLVQTLKGVKVDLAARFIADAKQLLASPPQPGTTSP